MNTGLINAKVFHGRYVTATHEFTHYVPFLVIDTESLDAPRPGLQFFSYNKFNLLSVHSHDYGFGGVEDFTSYVNCILHQAHFKPDFQKLYLITQPKILGGGFNPVSFWFGFDNQERLIFVLAEVNNTFGERHVYICNNPEGAPIEKGQWIKRNKQFHVSPFFKVRGEYAFHFNGDEKNLDVTINYYQCGELNLVTSLKGDIAPLTNAKILMILLKNPLQTFKVTFLIHYHALRLWLKKVPFFSKPPKPQENITGKKDD